MFPPISYFPLPASPQERAAGACCLAYFLTSLVFPSYRSLKIAVMMAVSLHLDYPQNTFALSVLV